MAAAPAPWPDARRATSADGSFALEYPAGTFVRPSAHGASIALSSDVSEPSMAGAGHGAIAYSIELTKLDHGPVEAVNKKDPLDRLRKNRVVRGLLDDAADAALEKELTEEVGAAIKKVEELPPPDRATLFDDVYAEPTLNLREQRDALAKLPPAPQH